MDKVVTGSHNFSIVRKTFGYLSQEFDGIEKRIESAALEYNSTRTKMDGLSWYNLIKQSKLNKVLISSYNDWYKATGDWFDLMFENLPLF